MDRLYITRETGTISRTDLTQVTLTMADGTTYEELEPRRLFPTTRPNAYITLLDKDEKEIALIRDLGELDDASREALEACFVEYYRMPQITRVVETRAQFGSLAWTVYTDRGGPITFRFRYRSDITTLGGGRVIVRDSNDNRYEIKNVNELDANSKRLLFPYL